MASSPEFETLTHRLILPREANHHGTLYAGSILTLALEAGYATAYRAVGQSANLVLKRVLDLRCFEPVTIGRVVEIRGREIYRARAQVVVGLRGTPLPDRSAPWMDSLIQFVQVDDSGHPEPFAVEPDEAGLLDLPEPWAALQGPRRLLAIRADRDRRNFLGKLYPLTPDCAVIVRSDHVVGSFRVMVSGQWGVVLRHVQRLFLGGSITGLTEGQLLDRFVTSRDEVAFGAIVARHGPMVLGVCRGVLDDPHDVEDAFQATFLVLVRKASGLRDRDLLGPWLYGVARRAALRARSDAKKRRARERPEVEAESAAVATFDAELRELQTLVREEVDRLPANDRMAVVYCYLEGLTHEEAADRLGWPIGTVKGRLSRAREKLRDRLRRRGVTMPAVFVVNAAEKISTIVPPSLITSTTLAAMRMAAGKTLTAGIVSAHAISLMEGVIGTMFTANLKIAALAIGATCAVAVPGVMAYQFIGPTSAPSQATNPRAEPKRVEAGNPASGDVAALKAAELTEARRVSTEFPEQALRVIDQLRATGEATDESDEASWSRRLVEAKSIPGIPPAERLKVLRAHLERMGAINTRIQSLVKSGQVTKLRGLESAYQLNEALQLVLEAEAGPRDNGKASGGGGGGGFGGADDSPARPILTLKQNPADEKRNEAIRKMLEEPISMNFPNDTPLEDIIKYIVSATQDKATVFPEGMPIYIDPEGLQDTDKTMQSTITINLVGIPLRTTLRLILRQLGLNYRVDSGLLLISDEESIAEQEKAEDAKARKQ